MVKKAFSVLFRYTIGPLSSKQLVRDRKLLAINIRNELSALQLSKGLSGIVLLEDFKQCFRRKMVTKFEAQKTIKLKAACFAAFVGLLRNKQWNDYSASKHWYRKCAGKFFYYWTEWNFENSVVNPSLATQIYNPLSHPLMIHSFTHPLMDTLFTHPLMSCYTPSHNTLFYPRMSYYTGFGPKAMEGSPTIRSSLQSKTRGLFFTFAVAQMGVPSLERKAKTMARSLQTISKIPTSVSFQSFSSIVGDGKNLATVPCQRHHQLARLFGVDDDETVSSMGWVGHHFAESFRGKNVVGEELSYLESTAVDVVDCSYLATSGAHDFSHTNVPFPYK